MFFKNVFFHQNPAEKDLAERGSSSSFPERNAGFVTDLLQEKNMNGASFEQCMEVLRHIAAGLSTQKRFRESLRPALTLLAEKLDFKRPHIVIQDPESLNLRLSLAYGRADMHVAYAPGRGVTGQVFASGTPFIVPRMTEHPDFRNRLFERSEEEMRELAFLCVPIRSDDASCVLGTLSADTPVADEGELRTRCAFLETVAALVGRHVAYLQEEMARRHFCEPQEDKAPLPRIPSIIGASPSIRQVLRQAVQVGPSRATALIRGESGTGKELMAEVIHRGSPRRGKPFVTMNCAALPPDLLEGELFGWRKGAFTNAIQNRKGLFEQADGGTLFLDEIGDLSLPAQAKVLRAIQDRQIQCLGSERLVTVDVRLVCATNRPLEQLVEQGLFREDLYYRINVFPIFMPPLRERLEDVPLLVDHFLQFFSEEYGCEARSVSTPALQLLMRHNWPGNVRELRNVMERAMLLCDEPMIRSYHLPPNLQLVEQACPLPAPEGLIEAVSQLEQERIAEALGQTQGNIHEAARTLKVTYRILYYKLKKYGIDYRDFVRPDVVD